MTYLRQAGAKAFARSANREAADFYYKALTALQRLPEHSDILRRAVDLRLQLRNPLYFLSAFNELHSCLNEAESIAQGLSDNRRLGRVINFLNSYHGLMGEHHRSIELGERGLRIWACPTRSSGMRAPGGVRTSARCAVRAERVTP